MLFTQTENPVTSNYLYSIFNISDIKEAPFDQRSFVVSADLSKRYPRATPVAIVTEFISYINIPKDDEESLKTICTSGLY